METGILNSPQHLSIEDYKTLRGTLNVTVSGEDADNELLLERTVTLSARLPPHSHEGRQLHGRFGPSHGSCQHALCEDYTRLSFQGPNLPDPRLLFDSVKARGVGKSFREHPNKLSSMMFCLPTIITPEVFQTDPWNRNFNLTSSINEGGRFTNPGSTDDHMSWGAWKKYGNQLFQTWRLVTCGLYVNTVSADDPGPEPLVVDLGPRPPAILWGDENWITKDLRCKLDRAVDPARTSVDEVKQALARYQQTIPGNPEERGFVGLRRGDDGTYSDNDLVGILTASIENVAGAFGADQVPNSLGGIEILGIT
ncbi:hypothetical protein DL764_003876 [Monosporascus ibericus]|uniref:Uncharacterized protein n=1 Tax=Monosporascus ibericus TaxID=155417 RepID=A0A4Q4TJE7_9PEZI|nr:hypothetical protein DL764_003876 [Monosporascus ibericus]